IMSDDHTSQAWGIYGGVLKNLVKNDNIKRLAKEGVVLDNAFCTNSICTPSRATILTGQYSHQHGVYTLSEALDPDSMNIAKVLQKSGYETAIIGKWHLKKQPTGFDYFKVLPGQGRYHNPILKTKENWEDGNKGGTEHQGFSADVIGDLSVEWLAKRNKDEPFFLMTHFKATHEPFDFPARYSDSYQDVEIPEPASLLDFSKADNGRTFIGQKLDILGQRYVNDTKNLTEGKPTRYPELPFSLVGLDKVQTRKKTYQKFIKDFMRSGAAIDDNIGKLLDYLAANDLAENTIVIYTADQGYFLGEHGMFDKRMIYEEALRMPFVMRYPKEIPAGTRNKDMVLNIDFPALFADYAGIPKPAFLKGQSFRENVKGTTPANWRKSMYYRYWLHQSNRPAHFGIRNERYKLAFFYGQSLGKPGTHKAITAPAWEFFDLQKDPKEMYNAYEDRAYATIINVMKKELIQLRKDCGDTDAPYPIMQEILRDYWE
ncbi:MAG: sulfatase, partial [Saprospiraceae bacterium]